VPRHFRRVAHAQRELQWSPCHGHQQQRAADGHRDGSVPDILLEKFRERLRKAAHRAAKDILPAKCHVAPPARYGKCAKLDVLAKYPEKGSKQKRDKRHALTGIHGAETRAFLRDHFVTARKPMTR